MRRQSSLWIVLALFTLVCLLTPSPAHAQPSLPFAAVTSANANLRAGPGTAYARIGGVSAGQALQVTDCDAGCEWYQLDTGAWIAASLVTPAANTATALPAQPEPAPAATPPAAAQPTANGTANLRSGPGTSYARLGSAQAGQRLTIVGRNAGGDWYQLGDGAWIAVFLVDGVPAGVPVVGVAAQTQSVQQPAVVAAPAQRVQEAPAVSGNCDPSYPGVCIPSPPPDLDCGEISYRRFQVVGSDPHNFDGDSDGIGCER